MFKVKKFFYHILFMLLNFSSHFSIFFQPVLYMLKNILQKECTLSITETYVQRTAFLEEQ